MVERFALPHVLEALCQFRSVSSGAARPIAEDPPAARGPRRSEHQAGALDLDQRWRRGRIRFGVKSWARLCRKRQHQAHNAIWFCDSVSQRVSPDQTVSRTAVSETIVCGTS